MLAQALWSYLFWWLYIIPFFFKIIVFFLKLSALNISTVWKGWRPVAMEIAEAGIRRGIAQGKYPPNPPEQAKSMEFMKANATLIGGFVVNVYFVLFTYLFAF